MNDTTLSLTLFACAFFHLWLQLYNRVLLTMDDSRIKLPVHGISLILMGIFPVLAMIAFRDEVWVSRILSWQPVTLMERFGFLIMFILTTLMLWRFGMVISDILLPHRSHRVLREVHRSVPVEKVPRRLPVFLKDQETTWDAEFRDVEIQLRHLPAEFDGLSIVMVSDVHYENDPAVIKWLGEVRHFVNALEPDIIAFTGDFVNFSADIQDAMEFHGGFEARMMKFGVLGNHDYWTKPRAVRRLARRNSIHLLNDETFELTREGRRLVFCGSDSPWNHQDVPWFNLTRAHESDCVIMLSHSPDNGPAAADRDVNLVLSGHNHGGQIRLPLFGPVLVPSKYGRKYSDGIYDLHESCTMVVSRGIGCSRVGAFGFLRLNCRPEVIRLTLRAPVVDIPVRVTPVQEKVFTMTDSDSNIITEPAFRTPTRTE